MCIAAACRKANDWYLGAMTNWDPRDLEIPLSFLGPGKYRAEVYADANDATAQPTHVAISTSEVDCSTVLKEHLVTGGGLAVRLAPAVK